jgi:hypothetical protein
MKIAPNRLSGKRVSFDFPLLREVGGSLHCGRGKSIINSRTGAWRENAVKAPQENLRK